MKALVITAALVGAFFVVTFLFAQLPLWALMSLIGVGLGIAIYPAVRDELERR